MPIVQVIQKCMETARDDFEEYCAGDDAEFEFSQGKAFSKCTEAAYQFYLDMSLKYSREPYHFERMDAAKSHGQYRKFDNSKKNWCELWGDRKIFVPDPTASEEDWHYDSVTSDRVGLEEEDGLSWGQWALIGGVVIVAGAVTVASGGTGSGPAALGSAMLLKAAGVGAAAGLLTYLGISDDESVPTT